MLKAFRNFIATSLILWLALPGTASAIVILDLSNSNPTFASNFASGSIFSDPAGLGWGLTITSTGGMLNSDAAGMGVSGGAGAGLDPGEGIIFDFNPVAMLEGFTLKNGANDTVMYIAVGTGGGFFTQTLPNAGAGGGNYFVNISLAADSLTIMNTSAPLPGAGYRVASLSFADAAASVPEPSTLGMLCIGFLGFAAARKLKKH